MCDAATLLAGLITSRDEDLPSSLARAAAEAEMSEEEINRIVSEVIDEVEEIGARLRIQVDHEMDIVVLLEKAKTALLGISEKLSTCEAHEPKTLPTLKTLEGEPSSGERGPPGRGS